jgi:hypothetical protein
MKTIVLFLITLAFCTACTPTTGNADYLAPPDRSCTTDADCVVKDVGNCCGYYPACLNKAAKTDPEGVKRQCEKDAVASICGFPTIESCTCVEGTCQPAGTGSSAQ